MLTPEYLWSVADPVVNIWEELNKWALKDICERIMAADLYDYHELPGTARYRAWLLNQSGMHYEEMISVIAALTRKSEKEVKRLFEEAGLLTLENDKPIYENQGLSIPDIRTNSGLFQILNEVYQRTNGELKNYTRTTLRNSQKQFYDSLDRAYMAVATGTRSYSEVIKETVEDLAKEGTRVTYPSGHKDTIEVAVRRAVLTGVNQGAARISLENALQNGYEYVAIDAHVGARVDDKDKIANHAGWQGKIFKIIGSTEQYGNLEEETGFPGNPLGLCGYNCRHHFFPHILGDTNPFEQNIPDEEENRKAYELSQKQRYMERKIRETKRNLLGLETCIKNCPDEKTKFELQMEYDKKAAKLQKQNQAYREFCKENKLQTEDERLKPAKWDKTNADSARGAAKRYNAAKNNGAKTAGAGKEVYFDKKKSYTVNIDEYSEEINQGISKSVKKVAEMGSRDRYEYSALVDLSTGQEVDFGTSEEHSSVNYYYKYLREHPDGRYVMIHNHNIDSGLSLPDIQELEMWKNMEVIVSVTNNGHINVAISNGERTTEYLYGLFAKERQKLLNEGKDMYDVEKELVKLAAERFVDGGIREYE